MALLDAALAFALTMAALATVVTIVMEIGLRFLGLRKDDQVKLIKRLYDDHLAPTTKLKVSDLQERWDVVRKVLENPLAGTKMAPAESQQHFKGLGCSPVYEEISVEHLLRRVIDIEEVKAAYNETEKELKAKLTALAQKYDEYRSAIATSFKCRAQSWSLVVGIVLALALNVDGVRLFQSYMDNPERTAEVITQMDPILDEVERSQEALRAPQATAPGESTLEDLDAAVQRMETQLATIQGFELPIGRLFYPHCLFLTEADERPRLADARCVMAVSPLETLTWLIKVVITGFLIGLGAPFWYDVAKRLAEVRRAFGGSGSALQRHRGSDGATAREEDRERLIDRIVREVRG